MADEQLNQKPQKPLAIKLPPLMPEQIYGKKGPDCEPEIPKEVEPCRGEIPFSQAPYIPLPPKEELPEIEVQPEQDFCVEIVEVPTLEKPVPQALEIPVDASIDEVMQNVNIEDIPVLPKPKPTLPNIVNAVVNGLRAWEPDQEVLDTLAGIKTTPATVGQILTPKPARKPKVYTASVERRVFTTQARPFLVLDFGGQVIATFGYEAGTFVPPADLPPLGPTAPPLTSLPFVQGFNFLTVPSTAGTFISLFDGPRRTFTNRLASTTYGIVRDITITMDPFCDFTLNPGDNFLALRSFALSFSTLMAGQVTIDSVPFPSVIPITSGIKSVGGSSSLFTNNYPQAFFTNPNQMCVSQINESTHQGPPSPIEIYLPPAGRYGIEISVPSRPIYPFGNYSAFNRKGVFAWTGVLTLTVEEITMLGAMAVQEPSPIQIRPQPWQPTKEPERPMLLKKKPPKKKKTKKKKKKKRPGRTEPEPFYPPELPPVFKLPPYKPPFPPYEPPDQPPYDVPPYQPPPSRPPYEPSAPATGPTQPRTGPDTPPPPEREQAPFAVKPPTPVRSLRRYLLCWDSDKKEFEKKPYNPGVVCRPDNDPLETGWLEDGGLF